MPRFCRAMADLVGAYLGAREHQHLRDVARFDDAHQGVELFFFLDLVHHLFDVFGGGVAAGDFDLERVLQEAARQADDVVVERRREQQGLPLRRQEIENALEVRQEAHVEHAIGFVQHEKLHLRQQYAATVGVIEQAARRGNQNFDAAAQVGLLDFHVDAAEHDGAAQRQMLVVGHHALMHLDRQFARRRQHQRAHRVARRRGAGIGMLDHFLQQRQHESGRLAGAGLRLRHQVAARPAPTEWPAPGSASASCSPSL